MTFTVATTTIMLIHTKGVILEFLLCSKCELRHDLFYVDNTRQMRGVLPGHAKRGEVGKVLEQIGRSSGSYSI